MIRYALVCDQDHDFDAWFCSGAAYDEQERARTVICPYCGSTEVKKAPMAPSIAKGGNEAASLRESECRKKTYAFLKDLRSHLEANAENVGPAFPEEARKVHYGESEPRSIYGEASLEEAEALREEGIPAVPLPPLTKDHN